MSCHDWHPGRSLSFAGLRFDSVTKSSSDRNFRIYWTMKNGRWRNLLSHSEALYVLSYFYWVIQLIVLPFTCSYFLQPRRFSFTREKSRSGLLLLLFWIIQIANEVGVIRCCPPVIMSYFPDFTVSNPRNAAHHYTIVLLEQPLFLYGNAF